MSLLVAPECDLAAALARGPARVVSLLSPGRPAPRVAAVPHLVLTFNDIAEPRDGLTPPDAQMLRRLIAFGAAWDEPEPLLVHCWMGISRSTAAAFVLACALDPARDPRSLAAALRAAAPEATPNRLMVALADDLLGRGGRMTQAVAAIGRGREASQGRLFALAARPGGTA